MAVKLLSAPGMLTNSMKSLIAVCFLILSFSGAGLSEPAVECDIELRLKETKQRIEKLQRAAFQRDRKYFETAKSKINELGEMRGWSKHQRNQVMTSILTKASSMTKGQQAFALSQRSDALDSAKRKSPDSCEKLAALQTIFLRLDDLNMSTWEILLKFIDRQIEREKSNTQ